MPVKTCDMCGKQFEGARNSRTCEACKHVKCPVCGEEMYLKGPKLTKYKEQGWITCGKQACAKEMTRRNLLAREGIVNVFQREEVRKRVADVRRNESESVRALRNENVSRAKRGIEKLPTPPKEKPERKRRSEYSRPKKICRICGKEYCGEAASIICDDCRHAKCAICGKPMELRGRYVTRFIEKGYVTCSRDCATEMVKRTNRERYGRDFSWCNDSSEKVSAYHSQHPDATIAEAASALGLTYGIVQHWAFKNGISFKRQADSTKELIVASYLDGLGVKYIRHERKQIAPKELDFYIEHNGRKVAIEVNDFATHNMTFSPFGEPKPHRYHYDKTLACRERGIALIHAWEHCLPDFDGRCRFGSWEVLKNRIEHAMGLTPVRHYARDMKVAEFPAADTRAFFDANNINGYRRANTTYALVPKSVENPTPDDIVMAYAVGDAFFGKGKYDAEVARGACRLHETVVGGASKLWKHITGTGRYSSIVYYVDLNYYGADSMPDMDGVRFVEHRDSFWNFWTETGELKNREPRRNREITAGYKDGSVWKVENAGTDVYVWEKG